MSSKKIIAIVGATGNQGSSVAHTFLKLPDWHVRCLTRNPSSSASQELASKGAEVVQADLADASSLTKAFADATFIFVNTDFWGPYIATKTGDGAKAYEVETLHGKNAAHAAAAVPTLQRFIYSSFPPAEKVAGGKFASASYHSRTKGNVAEYIVEKEPELAKKTSYIYIGAYNANAFLQPRFDPASGKYIFVTPLPKSVKLPIINPRESTGPLVQALFEEESGTHLLAYDTDSYLTIGEATEAWIKASGKEAPYTEVSTDFLHEKFGIPWEVLDAPKLLVEYGYMGGVEHFIEPAQLKTEVKTKPYKQWLAERDWKVVLQEMESGTGKPLFRSMEK